jgi:adenylate cyclase
MEARHDPPRDFGEARENAAGCRSRAVVKPPPRHADVRRRTGLARTGSLRGVYFGIIGLLLGMMIALVGGIIWYNSIKTNELVVASAERLILETDEKILDRLKLLYDPIYAIVGLASQLPELTSPSIKNDPHAKAMFLRGLRIYPQIRSLYVGFDNGEFFMVTHIAGDEERSLRDRLGAPQDAVFANEIVDTDAAGRLKAHWIFLADDGRVVGRNDATPEFDPRSRSWYRSAKQSDMVERSKLYVFASSGDSGFTLSRRFDGTMAGVMGADLAAKDLARFLREQSITKTSTTFIFTKTGEIVVAPGLPVVRTTATDDQSMIAPAKITDMDDPVISGLVNAYEKHLLPGSRIYNVDGRTYIGRISEIPPRYGANELLAIMVPLDEILSPVIKLRNETLFYSLAFLVFALPLYITIIVHLIDRRLGRHKSWLQPEEED